MPLNKERLLETMFRRDADICWLEPGQRPRISIEGVEKHLQVPTLTAGDMIEITKSWLPAESQADLAREGHCRTEAVYDAMFQYGFKAARAGDSYVIAVRVKKLSEN